MVGADTPILLLSWSLLHPTAIAFADNGGFYFSRTYGPKSVFLVFLPFLPPPPSLPSCDWKQ